MSLLVVALKYLAIDTFLRIMRNGDENLSINNQLDQDNILPVYTSLEDWRPISQEKLYILRQVIKIE